MTNSADLLNRGARAQRIAILGIGNELNGDDAAGVLVARELIEKCRGVESKAGSRKLESYVIEAGAVPEAFTGPLRRFQPDMVILVDAAELGESPGTVGYFHWQQAEGMSASTHTLPPTILAQFLIRELGCEVFLVGIQPKSLTLDAGVSAEVRRAAGQVVAALQNLIA